MPRTRLENRSIAAAFWNPSNPTTTSPCTRKHRRRWPPSPVLTSLFACTRAKTPRALHWNIGCRRFGFRGIDEGYTSVKVGFITPLYFPLCDLYSKPESRWLCRVSWLLGRSSEGFHEKTMGYSPGALGLALLGANGTHWRTFVLKSIQVPIFRVHMGVSEN